MKAGKSPLTREIIGESYQGPKKLTAEYAKHDLPVLFIGETGSGKDLFIKFYMENSARQGTKDTINCAAVSPSLLQSEVFGHVKGAFTGAVHEKKGLLRRCDKGILCLDEIGDAPPDFQEAIFRVAEGHPFYPVGAECQSECTSRIIAATNKPGKVKPELKYRFHLIPIPPLWKRDIPALCGHFLHVPKGRYLKAEVVMELCQQRYPGNIRELQRRCEALLAEKEDRVFTTRREDLRFHPTDLEANTPLDYDRYLREFRIWNDYLGPVIESFEFKFRYQYQYYDPRLENNSIRYLADPVSGIYFWGILEAARDGITEVIDDHKKAPTREAFGRAVQRLIAAKQLPYLLAHIERVYAPKEPNQIVNAYEYAPQLINLLHLPINKAKNQFAEIYFSYVGKIHPTPSEAAQYVGMTTAAYNKRKQRRKPKTEEITQE